MKFWVYKLTYDAGAAPHVRDGLLSLAICKPKIRLGAAPGDVIFGFGGRSRPVIRGQRLIYVARVTSKLAAPGEYYERPQYRGRWDCIYDRRGERLVWRPCSLFHENGSSADGDIGPAPVYPRAVVLLSDQFRYLGTDGTLEYARRWPDLGTFVHELGIGHRQVEPGSHVGRMLAALMEQVWTAQPPDRPGLPTEPPNGMPTWEVEPAADVEPPPPQATQPRGGGCAPRPDRSGCAPAESRRDERASGRGQPGCG